MNTAGILPAAVPANFLHLLPLLVLFPVPGFDRIPVSVRLIFCLAMAVVLLPATPVPQGEPASLYIGQFLLGLALALGVHACLAGIHIGGHLIDTQAGTNAAGIFNPSHAGTGVFAEFLMLAVATTILMSDTVIIVLGQTMAHGTPINFASLDPGTLSAFLEAFGRNLAAGFLLTFPVIAGLWLIDVLAAASSRLLPQSNIYFLFLPIKTFFATLILLAYLGLFLGAADRLVADALVR